MYSLLKPIFILFLVDIHIQLRSEYSKTYTDFFSMPQVELPDKSFPERSTFYSKLLS